jgi:nicotinate-nucleotide adenylyltransferase
VKSPEKRRNCSPAAKSDQGTWCPRVRTTPPRAAAGPIGVLGGIFDPVHNGHLAVAALARDYFGLSKVLIIPAGCPPHKAHVGASAAERVAMLRLAIKKEPMFDLRTDELRRRGVSYSFDTLCKLTGEFCGRPLHFIIGSDNLPEIEVWYRFREVLRMVTLCVAHRPGYPMKIPRSLRSARISIFPSPEWGVSATMVREYVSRGYSCRHLVPEAVAAYIAKKRLYTKR